MKQPNIVFFFSDQQRFDSLGCNGQPLDVTPTLDRMAREGVNFRSAYTNQPVCGPARAMLQTGLYPTQVGCFRNGVSLPRGERTLAARLREAGYRVAYVGKWHLASDFDGNNFETKAVPAEYRGGYNNYWVASDILEFTSHGYGGYLHDQDGNKREFTGYRTDCVTDYALDYLDMRSPDEDKPFFLMISHIEPHHQNDRDRFEGPEGSREQFGSFTPPPELVPGQGDWEAQYADYLGCCRALDDNLSRVLAKLRERGIYENTIVIYTSDHGCHFKTRIGDCTEGGYDDYKRSCYENAVHIPMVITGPGFRGKGETSRMAELIDIPRTIVRAAGGDDGGMQGSDLRDIHDSAGWKDEAYIQISESYLGRAVRTSRYTYCVCASDRNPNREAFADVYTERFLFDNEADQNQVRNLAGDPELQAVREELAGRIFARAKQAGEPDFVIR